MTIDDLIRLLTEQRAQSGNGLVYVKDRDARYPDWRLLKPEAVRVFPLRHPPRLSALP